MFTFAAMISAALGAALIDDRGAKLPGRLDARRLAAGFCPASGAIPAKGAA